MCPISDQLFKVLYFFLAPRWLIRTCFFSLSRSTHSWRPQIWSNAIFSLPWNFFFLSRWRFSQGNKIDGKISIAQILFLKTDVSVFDIKPYYVPYSRHQASNLRLLCRYLTIHPTGHGTTTSLQTWVQLLKNTNDFLRPKYFVGKSLR